MTTFASLTALRQRFPGIGLAHGSLVFIGLMWLFPFLYYVHRFPLTTFYQEWSAAMLGLGGMLLLVTKRCWQKPEVPRILLLPIGLMLIIWLQFVIGKIGYFSHALLVTLYLLWAALLIVLGQRLREELGLPALATALAAFLLLGAELSALIGILQNFTWRTFMDAVVTFKSAGGMFGNLGQPNHFANYTSLGLISLGLLHTRWKLRTWQVVLLAVPLLYVLVMSGSRSSWLYLLCMTGMAFLWQRRDKAAVTLLYYSLAVLLGFGLMHWLVANIPLLGGSYGSVTTVQRMFERASGGSIRLHLWYEAWLIFLRFPLLGAGVGQFGWEHFQLGPVLHDLNISDGFYNNAHNLVLQVAAEMGAVGLIVLTGTLGLWLRQAFNAQRTLYHWWGYGLIMVLGIHSMLEYPLWYGYFLGVAAFTLGMLDNTAYRLGRREKSIPQDGDEARRGLAGRGAVAAILLSGALLLSLTLQSYLKLEDLNSRILPEEARDNSYAQRVLLRKIQAGLVALDKGGQALLLHQYIEFILGETEWDHVADQGALNGRVLHLLPVGSVAYREALLLARAGQQAEARMQMERAIWLFPGGFPAAMEKLRMLAEADPDPGRFPALMGFALQKYTERRSLANAKSLGKGRNDDLQGHAMR